MSWRGGDGDGLGDVFEDSSWRGAALVSIERECIKLFS